MGPASGENLRLDTQRRGRLSPPLQPFACIDGDGGPCPSTDLAGGGREPGRAAILDLLPILTPLPDADLRASVANVAAGSPEAAAAKAAHDVLVDIFPPQAASLDTVYRDYLAKKGLAEDNPGIAVGQKAAAGILALRANDGRMPNPPPPPFTGDNATGVWRPTISYQSPPPPSGAPMLVPWLGTVPCFTLQSGDPL